MIEESEDLQRLLRSPVFSADEQLSAVGAVLDKAKIKGLAGNFVRVVASNRRLFAVPDMVRAFAARLAEFYPVSEGIENSLPHLQKKIDQGYSLMAFPEGTRSGTNKMRRWHKGAF